MRKLSLSLLTLSLGVALLPLAQAATTPAQEHLLEQVRLGAERLLLLVISWIKSK